MKKLKKAVCLFLAFAMAVGLLQAPSAGSVTAFGAETAKIVSNPSEGTLSGTDIAWKLEEDKDTEWDLAQGTPLKLTLSGSGVLSLQLPFLAPWYSDHETITSVIIEDGITEIGKEVFKSYYPSLKAVTFADSVTTIGESAFEGCSLLESLNFGNGLQVIGTGAFQKCNELKSLTLPDSVETVGDFAFNRCQDLAELVCGAGLRTIGESAFYYNALTTIEFNEGLKTIGTNAFGFNMNLKEVHFKEGLETIGERAFSTCMALETVSLPDSLTTIKAFCFEGTLISSFTIPQNVTSIEGGCLAAASFLKNIQVAEGNGNFCVKNSALYEVKEGKPYRAIAFARNQDIASFAVEEGTQIIDIYAFYGVRASTITLPDTIKEIRGWAFQGCSSVKEINIPDSVEVIGEFAFDQCMAMTQITIGKNVREVGGGIFWNCMALQTITVSEENPYLDAVENVLYDKGHTHLYAYARAKQDTEYHVLDGVTSLSDHCIYSDKLKKLYMPKSLSSLQEESIIARNMDSIYFSGNAPSLVPRGIAYAPKELLIYRIPGTFGWDDEQWSSFQLADWAPEVTTVEEGSFGGVSWQYEGSSGRITFTGSGAVPDFTPEEMAPWSTYMSSIQTVHTEGVSGIGNYAFSNAENLIRIGADSALKQIGNYAFADCGKLSLPGIDTIDTIGDFAFQNDSSIQGHFALDKVTFIGKGAFQGCTGITEAALGTSLTSLEDGAFEGCAALEMLLLPETVTSIKADALKGCGKLSSVHIPSGVDLIGANAFGGDASLKKVYFYGGVPSEWAADSFENCGGLTLYYRTSQEGWRDMGDAWNGLPLVGLDRFYTGQQDTYSFANTASSFGYGSDYRVPRQRYVDVLTSITTGTYYYAINNLWGGSCYGMLGTSLEFYNNPAKLADYSPSAKTAYEIAAPADQTASLTKWIEAYHISQYNSSISGIDGEIINHMFDYKGIIKRVEEFERSGGFLGSETEPLIMPIYSLFKGAHAVVPVSVDQAENGDFLLKIYDPNVPSELQTLIIDKELSGIDYDGYMWASYIDYSAASQAMSGIALHGTEKDNSVYLSVDKENGAVTDAEGRGIDEIEGAYEQKPISGEDGSSGIKSFVLPKGSYKLFAEDVPESQADGEDGAPESITFYMASEDIFVKAVSSDEDAVLSVKDSGTGNGGVAIEIQSPESAEASFTLVNQQGMERTVEVKSSNASITVAENDTITVEVPVGETTAVSIDGKQVQTDNGTAECSFVASASENPLRADELDTDIHFNAKNKISGTVDASVVLNAASGRNVDVKVEYVDQSGKSIATYSAKKVLKAGLNLIDLSFEALEPSFIPTGDEAVVSCTLTVTDEAGNTVSSAVRKIAVKLPENPPEDPNPPVTTPEDPNPPVTTPEDPNPPVTTPEDPNPPATTPDDPTPKPNPPTVDPEDPSKKPNPPAADPEDPSKKPNPPAQTPPAGKPAAKVTKVKVKPSKLTLGVGESFQLAVSVFPKQAGNAKLSYRASNKKVAVSKKGKIVAKKTGTSKVTIKAANGKKAEVKVTIKKAPKKIVLNASKKTLKVKGKFQIKVKLPKGTASRKITYTSNKKSVATVSSSGKITAKKKGKAVITVKTYNGKKAKIKLTVK